MGPARPSTQMGPAGQGLGSNRPLQAPGLRGQARRLHGGAPLARTAQPSPAPSGLRSRVPLPSSLPSSFPGSSPAAPRTASASRRARARGDRDPLGNLTLQPPPHSAPRPLRPREPRRLRRLPRHVVPGRVMPKPRFPGGSAASRAWPTLARQPFLLRAWASPHSSNWRRLEGCTHPASREQQCNGN